MLSAISLKLYSKRLEKGSSNTVFFSKTTRPIKRKCIVFGAGDEVEAQRFIMYLLAVSHMVQCIKLWNLHSCYCSVWYLCSEAILYTFAHLEVQSSAKPPPPFSPVCPHPNIWPWGSHLYVWGRYSIEKCTRHTKLKTIFICSETNTVRTCFGTRMFNNVSFISFQRVLLWILSYAYSYLDSMTVPDCLFSWCA